MLTNYYYTHFMWKWVFTGLLLLIGIAGLNAQEIGVSGKIISEDESLPLIGVNILIKNSSVGTITDIDGNYSLQAPADAVLVFSYTGYSTQEIDVAGRSTIDFSMAQDIASLGEIVVVGYGTAKKSDLTGSVESLNSKSFESQPIVRMDQALQGRTAGVQINANQWLPWSGL